GAEAGAETPERRRRAGRAAGKAPRPGPESAGGRPWQTRLAQPLFPLHLACSPPPGLRAPARVHRGPPVPSRPVVAGCAGPALPVLADFGGNSPWPGRARRTKGGGERLPTSVPTWRLRA